MWANQRTNAAPTTGQANPYRLYTYNANGEPTQIERRDTTASPVVTDTLEWDGMGKLRKVTSGGTVVYTATYDGAGDRVQSVLNGTTHTYSYGAGLLYDSVGSTTYTPGVSHRQAGVDSYYHEDWIGSTRYTTDGSGLVTQAAQRWDAFGNLTASAGSHGGSLKWVGGAGYEADGPLGTSLLGARYYDPAVGRFLNADPIGIAGGINQFGYCGEDPVNRIDPSGLDWFGEPLSEDEEAILKIAVGIGTTAGGVLGGAGGGTGGFIFGGVAGAGIGAIPGTVGGVIAGGAAGAVQGGVAGGAIGLVGIYGARGIRALAGSLATLAATKGGGASCPTGGGGGFKGPKAKDFDWDHIFRNHAPWGEVAKQRGWGVFEGLNKSQIMARVRAAWNVRQKIGSPQIGPDGATRHLYHGTDPKSGQKLGFWQNEANQLVESAFPIVPGKR